MTCWYCEKRRAVDPEYVPMDGLCEECAREPGERYAKLQRDVLAWLLLGIVVAAVLWALAAACMSYL